MSNFFYTVNVFQTYHLLKFAILPSFGNNFFRTEIKALCNKVCEVLTIHHVGLLN